MWMIDAAIVCCVLAFLINLWMLWKGIKDYRADKRRARREKVVHVRAEDLAAVIAEFVNE